MTVKKNQQILFGVFFMFIFILIYVLNRTFPLVIDDWKYIFIFGEAPLRKVLNLEDLFVSQYNHYMTWGGRTIVHSIAQVLLLLDPFWHDLLNSIVFTLLIYFIYKISNFASGVKPRVLILVFLLYWFLQPGFASVFFWITGSANYLWSTFIIISFMYPFYTYYRNNNKSSNNTILAAVATLFLGIIAGWTNENMSIALIFYILGFLYLLKKEERRIPTWAFWGLVGVVIGTIILLIAPGNHIRYVTESVDNNLDTTEGMLSLETIFLRMPKIAFLYIKRLLWLVIPYLVMLYYFQKQESDDRESKAKIVKSSLLFFISANIAFLVMLASPGFPARAFTGIITLLIIAIGIIYANFELKTLLIKKINLTLLIIALLAFGVDYGFKYKTIHLIDETLQNREHIIIAGKKQGIRNFVFTDGIKVSSRHGFTDCNEDPNFWINRLYSDYYGLDSIKVYLK